MSITTNAKRGRDGNTYLGSRDHRDHRDHLINCEVVRVETPATEPGTRTWIRGSGSPSDLTLGSARAAAPALPYSGLTWARVEGQGMTLGVEPVAPRRVGWDTAADRGLRTFAAVTVAAVGLSVLVGGIGGRLAMALLASMNPENDGRISDDGFVIGRFDLGGTVQLLLFSVQIGLVAAACYLVARHLVIGPRWFQVTSMALGAGVVVGAVVVRPDGIDFTAFDPPLLPIVLFVAIPMLYVAALAVVAERLVASDRFHAGDARLLAVITFLLWALGAVTLGLLLMIVAIWAGWHRLRETAIGTALGSPAAAWAARGVLTLAFVAALTNLVDDTSVLV